MKQIKHFALGLLGASLLAAGLYACSSEDSTTMQQEETAFQTKNGTFTGGPIAEIVNGIGVPLYDETEVKAALIDNGTYAEIESIELAYGINPVGNKPEAFITVIAKETTSSPVIAIVADLVIDGNELIILNPEDHQAAFAKHSCKSVNCTACQFDRSWFLARIKGCLCNGAGEDGKPAWCRHDINGGGVDVLDLTRELVKAAL